MKKKVYAVLFIIFVLAAGIAGYHVISDQLDYKQSNDYYQSLSDAYVQTVVPEAETDEPRSGAGLLSFLLPASAQAEDLDILSEPELLDEYISPEESSDQEKAEEEEYISGEFEDEIVIRTTTDQAPIRLNFNGMLSENPDVVGWIYCEGTPINYPVLQAEDNKKYLDTQPNGEKSRNGSIFLDCLCSPDFSSDNSLIYGHNRKDVMFASLFDYAKKGYYEEHPVMWLLTPDVDYKVDLIASFVCNASDWVYTIGFDDEKAQESFLRSCLRASDFKTAFTPESSDRLITLSTCNSNYDGARYVVVGVLSRCVK